MTILQTTVGFRTQTKLTLRLCFSSLKNIIHFHYWDYQLTYIRETLFRNQCVFLIRAIEKEKFKNDVLS